MSEKTEITFMQTIFRLLNSNFQEILKRLFLKMQM